MGNRFGMAFKKGVCLSAGPLLLSLLALSSLGLILNTGYFLFYSTDLRMNITLQTVTYEEKIFQ